MGRKWCYPNCSTWKRYCRQPARVPISKWYGMFDQFQSQQTRSLVISLAIHIALCIAILAAGFTVQTIVAPGRISSVQWIAPVPIPPMKRRTIQPPKRALTTVAKLPPIKLTAPAAEPEPTVLKAPPRPVPAIVAKQPELPAQPPDRKSVV